MMQKVKWTHGRAGSLAIRPRSGEPFGEVVKMRQKVAKIVLLLVFVLASSFNTSLFDNQKAHASSTVKIANPNYTFEFGNGSIFEAYDASASIAPNIVITRIKYTATVTRKGEIDGFLTLGTYGYLNAGYYYDGIQMPLPASGTRTYEIQFDPNDSWGKKRVVCVSPSGWSGKLGTSYRVTISEIEYIEYKLDGVELQITPDRNVAVVVKSNSPVKLGFKVKNRITGKKLSGTLNGVSASVVDDSVMPEKYYTYDVYIGIGYTYYPIDDYYPGYIEPYQAVYVGAFTVKVPSDATYAKEAAEAAQQAAQGAQQAAQQAQQAAQQAASGVNYIQNNILSTSAGVVQDSQGTVLMEARLAKIKADQAVTAIGNVESKVDNIQNKVGNIESQLSDVQNQISSQLSAVQNQLNQVNNNIANAMPPILMKVKGYNGATATKTSSIRLVLEYANANKYRYRLNGGGWSAWQAIPSDGVVTISGLTSPGVYTIQIEIRNEPAGYAGTAPLPAATGSFTAYRL